MANLVPFHDGGLTDYASWGYSSDHGHKIFVERALSLGHVSQQEVAGLLRAQLQAELASLETDQQQARDLAGIGFSVGEMTKATRAGFDQLDQRMVGMTRAVDGVTAAILALHGALGEGLASLLQELHQTRQVLESIDGRLLLSDRHKEYMEDRQRGEKAIAEAVREANSDLRRRWYEDALDLLEDARGKFRFDPTLHLNIGWLHVIHTADTDAALECFVEAYRHASEDNAFRAQALRHTASTRCLRGATGQGAKVDEYEAAYVATQQALTLSPNHTELIYEHVRHSALTGRSQEAIQHLRKAIAANRLYWIAASVAVESGDLRCMASEVAALFDSLRSEARERATTAIDEAQAAMRELQGLIKSLQTTEPTEVLTRANQQLARAVTLCAEGQYSSCLDAATQAGQARRAVADAREAAVAENVQRLGRARAELRQQADEAERKLQTELSASSRRLAEARETASKAMLRGHADAFYRAQGGEPAMKDGVPWSYERRKMYSEANAGKPPALDGKLCQVHENWGSEDVHQVRKPGFVGAVLELLSGPPVPPTECRQYWCRIRAQLRQQTDVVHQQTQDMKRQADLAKSAITAKISALDQQIAQARRV